MNELRLDVLTLDGSDPDPLYMLSGIMDVWRRENVSVTCRPLTDPSTNADPAIVHVDRTFVSPDLLSDVRARYPRVLNGSVADISKKTVSHRLIDETAAHDGPVIVKTNLNYHGHPEANSRAPWHRVLGSLHPNDRSGFTRRYQVLEGTKDVPDAIWRDDRFVVEAFTPERQGTDYVLRQWIFLGDRDYVVKTWSKYPVIKADNTEGREKFDSPVPTSLCEERNRMQFDYGKFDYVIVDGEAVLLDANKTSAMVGRGPGEQAVFELLAAGLKDFVDR